MLRLDDLTCASDDFRLTADLQVDTGSLTAIIGPSGAGKSTLLNTIAGFLPPASGRILWDDTDLTPLAPGKRPIAMLFQDGNLFPHLSVEKNVALGLSPTGKLTSETRAKVDTALDRVGLHGLGSRKPGTLSGGQQSRAALARILVQHRPLILLDEPFAALGPALKAEMLDLVAELARAQHATLLMITHDPEDARRIAPDTIVVSDGVATPPQPTQALLDNPPPALHDYLRASA